MNQLTITEQFDGHPITFQAGDAFVNLTTMCAGFPGRMPKDFLRLESTKAFVIAMEPETGGNPPSLFFTTEGRNGGTWAHPDLCQD